MLCQFSFPSYHKCYGMILICSSVCETEFVAHDYTFYSVHIIQWNSLFLLSRSAKINLPALVYLEGREREDDRERERRIANVGVSWNKIVLELTSAHIYLCHSWCTLLKIISYIIRHASLSCTGFHFLGRLGVINHEYKHKIKVILINSNAIIHYFVLE